MSELSAFIGKPLERELGGKVWKFPTLGAEDLEVIMDASSDDKRVKTDAIIKLVKKYVLVNIPDATDDELKALPLSFVNDLLRFVFEANGVKEKDLGV